MRERRREFGRAAILALVTLLAGPAEATNRGGPQAGRLDLEFLTQVRCAGAIAAQLAAWDATGESFPDFGTVPRTRIWRLPTRQFGVWVIAHIDEHHDVTLDRLDSRELHRITFRPPCNPEAIRADRSPETAWESVWTDGDLAALIQTTGTGVLFIWSPHMPLSVDAYHHAARAAAAEGIAMTGLLHPDADAAYARAAARSGGLPAAALRSFRSVELSLRNATIHAPSALVYREGGPVALAFPGYRDEAGYRALIRSQLELPEPVSKPWREAFSLAPGGPERAAPQF